MEEIQIVQFIQKKIKERKSNILDILENNGISAMEQYSAFSASISSAK